MERERHGESERHGERERGDTHTHAAADMAAGPVHALAYSASPGTYILTGSADRAVRLYNPAAAATAEGVPQGRLIQTYKGHGHEVLGLDVAGDNERFVSAGGDRAVFLWDVATATTTRRFGGPHGHAARVNCVAFAGDGGVLVASGGVDATVRFWDARGGGARPVQVLGEARDAVTALAAAGPELVAGSVDGRVRAYDVRMGRCATDVLGASVTSLALARDARALVVASLDGAVRLLDRRDGACLRAYAAPRRRNAALRVQAVLGARERYVVAGDEMTGPDAAAAAAQGLGRVWAWDLVTGKVAAEVRVPWGPPAAEQQRKRLVVGRDGAERARANVVSCLAWQDAGWGPQFCVAGTSGVVTVFGAAS